MDATFSPASAPPVARSNASYEPPRESPASTRTLVQHKLAVVIVGSALGALAFASYSTLAHRLIAALIAVVLAIVAATDLERRIIPNRVILPALAIVLAARTATDPSPRWGLAALGAGLFFLLPNLINSSAMGMGDVKLAAFLGAGLGTAVIPALLLGLVSTLPFALTKLVRGGLAARKSTLPFGPFLAFGGLVILIVPRLLGVAGG